MGGQRQEVGVLSASSIRSQKLYISSERCYGLRTARNARRPFEDSVWCLQVSLQFDPRLPRRSRAVSKSRACRIE